MNVQKLLIIFLNLGLVSCEDLTAPSIDDVHRRLVYFEVVSDDGEFITIKKESAHCRIQKYQHSLNYIGPIGEGKDIPLQECAGTIGYSLDDYRKLVEAKEKLRLKAVQAGVIARE